MRFTKVHPTISLADKAGLFTLAVAGAGVLYFVLIYLMAG
jgi:hypothetical protein